MDTSFVNNSKNAFWQSSFFQLVRNMAKAYAKDIEKLKKLLRNAWKKIMDENETRH